MQKVSKLSIINLALGKVGGEKHASLSDVDADLQRALDVYDTSKQEVLSSFSWGFATVFKVLARNAVNPEWGYKYAYRLPVDCVRIIGAHSEPSVDSYNIVFEDIQNSVYTDSGSVYLRYLSATTDESYFSDVFQDLVSTKIAAEIAMQTSKSPSLRNSLQAEYRFLFEEAKLVETFNSNPPEKKVTSSFIDVR